MMGYAIEIRDPLINPVILAMRVDTQRSILGLEWTSRWNLHSIPSVITFISRKAAH